MVTSICLTISMPAFSETFTPFVSAGIEHDDNIFRVPTPRSAQTNGGADTFSTMSGGLRFIRPISRQIITGVAEISSIKYDQNFRLDHTRKDLRGDWHWFVAARLEGHVGGRYVQELAPFADFDIVGRNLRTNKRYYVDGSWRFHPSWQWRTGYTKDEYSYDLTSQRTNDRTEEFLTSGMDFLASSGSTVGLQLRRLEGSYPRSREGGGKDFLENGYIQDEAKINVLWLVTGSTQLLFLGGWVQRNQRSDADRVRRGANARMIANWTPTGRIKLVGQAWREFSAIDGALTDSALSKGASAVVTWDLSGKIQAVVNLKHETRQFTPYSGGPSVLTVSARTSDNSNLLSAGLIYRPIRGVTLKASAFSDQRSGSVVAGTKSYKANGAVFNVSLEFQ